jgi:hypothetical protein
MIAGKIMSQRSPSEKDVERLPTEQFKKYQIGNKIGRIIIDRIDNLQGVIIFQVIDRGEIWGYQLKDMGGQRKCRDQIEDNGPGMTGLDRSFVTVVQAAQTVFAVIFPIGSGVVFPSHRDGVVGTGTGTFAAADTSTVGKHHFPHKKTTKEEIEDGEEGEKIQKQGSPSIFPEVVFGKPD